MIRSLAALAVAAATLSSPALANEFAAEMEAFLEQTIRAWADDPILIEALEKQNDRTATYDSDRIGVLDRNWQAEVGAADTPTIDAVIAGPAAEFLRQRIAESDGAISEIFVMDAVGLNVASSGITSDYWQGDEAKWAETYRRGPGAVHFSEIEFDESTQTWQGQISFTIAHPVTGEAIGAMTVAIDAEQLM